MEILTQVISCSKHAMVSTQLKGLENVNRFFNQHEAVVDIDFSLDKLTSTKAYPINIDKSAIIHRK